MSSITRTIIGVLGASLVALSILALAPAQQHAAAEGGWHATWAFHPKSMAEARQQASAIVVARVTEVRQAEDIVVEAAAEPEGVDRVPTQRISFDVVRSIKGDSDGSLTLFHTGNNEQYIEGDPPYAVGETYLLFVEPKTDEAGTSLVISPEGRFKVVNGKVEPMVDKGYAGELRGKALAEVIRSLVGDSKVAR